MTNFEKVKEQWTFQRREPFGGQICSVIRKMRNIKDVYECYGRDCSNCKEWLTQEYKEKILDDVEREYLSAVIKPFRGRIVYISKEIVKKEFIKIILINDTLGLPYFEAGTMYKGMKLHKRYTLKELGL